MTWYQYILPVIAWKLRNWLHLSIRLYIHFNSIKLETTYFAAQLSETHKEDEIQNIELWYIVGGLYEHGDTEWRNPIITFSTWLTLSGFHLSPSTFYQHICGNTLVIIVSGNGPLAKYVKLRVAHAPGMPGMFSPPPRVGGPDMHHGPCVTHVPWCMPGSLISGIRWYRLRGKRSWRSRRMRKPQFSVSGKRPMTCCLLFAETLVLPNLAIYLMWLFVINLIKTSLKVIDNVVKILCTMWYIKRRLYVASMITLGKICRCLYIRKLNRVHCK